jgi:hypothetical protein
MVQFQNTESSHSLDELWKLVPGDSNRYDKKGLLKVLKDKHHTCKSRTYVRIQELYIRCQRGLLSYDGLPLRELKLFVKQRGMTVVPGKKPTLSSLKAQLEEADNDMTFDRVSDLPPELRQNTFQQYFDSFGEYFNPLGSYRFGKAAFGSQPLITLASRQTRQEALPIFYSRCQFGIARSYPKDWEGLTGITENVVQEAFVQNTPVHYFALIRFLTLLFDTPRNWSHRDKHVYVTININDDECPVKVFHIVGIYGGIRKSGEVVNRVNELFMLGPRAIVRSIAARPGLMKLQKNDMLLLLCNSVRDALQQEKEYRQT